MSPSLSALSWSWERGWFGLCSYSSAFLAFSRSGGLGSGSNHGGRRVSGAKNEIHSQAIVHCACVHVVRHQHLYAVSVFCAMERDCPSNFTPSHLLTPSGIIEL